MSNFYRDTDHKVFAGVCSGLAERFGWDVNTVRLVTVVATIVTTGWVVPTIYVVLWLILPTKTDGRMGLDDVKDAYDAKVKPTVDEKVKPFYDAKVKPTVDNAFGRPSGEPGPAPKAPTATAEKAEWEQPYDANKVDTDSFDENASTKAAGDDPFDLDEGRQA